MLSIFWTKHLMCMYVRISICCILAFLSIFGIVGVLTREAESHTGTIVYVGIQIHNSFRMVSTNPIGKVNGDDVA